MEGGSRYVDDVVSLSATELRLGLPGTEATEKPPLPAAPRANKRPLDEAGAGPHDHTKSSATGSDESGHETAPMAKTQVVGWPPIRSYRKNSLMIQATKKSGADRAECTGLYVKVSMDGAPYLRKIDLKVYNGYGELREALEGMFKCFSSSDSCSGASEFAITYEDKDGDLMLVGDVPWEMFINSCKRLRLMRGPEAMTLG